jgi:cysteine desulfurase family protein
MQVRRDTKARGSGKVVYLDNAATTFPKPAAVYERVEQVLRDVGGNPGRGSHRMAIEAARVVFGAREALASLINAADSSRVAFTKNATEAINAALKGVLRPGDHVVTTTFEHNSVSRTLARLMASGVEVTKVPPVNGMVMPAHILRALRPGTRLVCMTHASNVLGAVQPIGDIGNALKGRGVVFMVDGAQTVGALPVDVDAMGLDILAGTGHKALFGPQGTGFLYVGESVELEPLVDGGTGEADFAPEMPERLESGTPNTPGIGGLSAGVEFLLKTGVEEVRRRELALVGEVLKGLGSTPGARVIGPLDPEARASLVSFNIGALSPADVGQRLDSDFSIMVRSGLHCAPDAHREAGTHPEGAVRVSPGYFNTDNDVDEFLRAVAAIART